MSMYACQDGAEEVLMRSAALQPQEVAKVRASNTICL
jgi:hypothetical protein